MTDTALKKERSKTQSLLYLAPPRGRPAADFPVGRLYPICAARRMVLQIAQIDTSCEGQSAAVTSGRTRRTEAE
jgi:hypothetical protein